VNRPDHTPRADGGRRMKVLESTSLVDLTDRRVAVCGDWHGHTAWLRRVASTIARRAPDVRTALHAGDWWMDTRLCDEILAEAGIERAVAVITTSPGAARAGVTGLCAPLA
jgi:hypothetical protein